MSHSIAIIGAGWLGKPLAAHLVSKGHTVFGTTTRKESIPDLEALGIRAGILNLNRTLLSIPKADVYVITVPPSGSEHYVENIKRLRDAIADPKAPLIFCSSTSVYPDLEQIMTEDMAVPGSIPDAAEGSEAPHGTPRQVVLDAEGIIYERKNHVIMRLAGLIGGERHPVRFLSGRTHIKKPNGVVNLIHRDDLIQVVTVLIEQGITGEVFNVCADQHPTRKAYYTEAARRLHLPAPVFDETDASGGKTIDPGKLIRRTGIPLTKLF